MVRHFHVRHFQSTRKLYSSVKLQLHYCRGSLAGVETRGILYELVPVPQINGQQKSHAVAGKPHDAVAKLDTYRRIQIYSGIVQFSP